MEPGNDDRPNKDLLDHRLSHHLVSPDISGSGALGKLSTEHGHISSLMHGFGGLPHYARPPSEGALHASMVHAASSPYFGSSTSLLSSAAAAAAGANSKQRMMMGPAPGIFMQPPPGGSAVSTGPVRKRKIGSQEDEETLAQRRLSHKEVERRRREAINKGINDLAAIVPNCEKAKNSVLNRAVEYILELQNVQQQYYTLERHHEALQKECRRAWTEVDIWKNAAQKEESDTPKEK